MDSPKPTRVDSPNVPPDTQASGTVLNIEQKEEASNGKVGFDGSSRANDHSAHVSDVSSRSKDDSSTNATRAPYPGNPLVVVENAQSPSEPPRLALVTDIEIPQNFDFPNTAIAGSPPSSAAPKPRYNSAVVDEFDPLAKPKSPKTPVSGRPSTPTQGRPLTPSQGRAPTPTGSQGRGQTPIARSDQAGQRPPTPTSASATVATFPSIASIARSLISRPNSPITSSRPEFPGGSPTSKSPSLPHSPATRTRPIQPSNLATSSEQPQTPTTPDPEQFDFQKFLDQLKSRPADPVAKYLRRWVVFIPNLSSSIHMNMFISARMRECEIWKKAGEVEFDNAVEGMEKLFQYRGLIPSSTFTPQIARSGRPVTTDDLERDRVLKQRIALFQWIKPEHLDIPMTLKDQGESEITPSSPPAAENTSPTNAEKSTDSEISMGFLLFAQQGLIRHLRGDEGADSFIPLLIFVLIRANPEHLLSNIDFKARLMGAVSFIETMDHTSLSNITQEDFEKNVEQAIQALPPSPDPSSPAIAPAVVSSRSTASDLSQLSSASGSSSIGEESARTLQLPQVAAIAEDTRKFLERTGESLSKPLNAIGRIFSEVLDDEPRSPSSGYPGSSQAVYRPRSGQPGAMGDSNTQTGLLPPLQFHNLGFDTSNPTTPNGGPPPTHPVSRATTPLDFSAMQAEIDRAHAAAADAARATLHQIFPTMDKEVTDMVLEANNGDLGRSIDKLLEMSTADGRWWLEIRRLVASFNCRDRSPSVHGSRKPFGEQPPATCEGIQWNYILARSDPPVKLPVFDERFIDRPITKECQGSRPRRSCSYWCGNFRMFSTVSASLCALFLLPLVTYAAPTNVPRAGVTALAASQVAAYKPYTLLTRAGYCPASKTATWSCGTPCTSLSGFVPYASGGDGVVTPYWYVGYYPAISSVVVANQGTDPSKFVPLLIDGDFILDGFDSALFPGLPTTLKAHGGFLDAQGRGASAKLAAVKKALATYPGATVATVGHSLGGAISLLDAVYLKRQISGIKLKVVTYGQPRVGNPAFASWVDANVSSQIWMHIVPIVPGRGLGFAHSSGEKHILAPGSWVACAGQDNTDGQCTTGDVSNILVGDVNDHGGPYEGIHVGSDEC
ncbi:lipase [Rhizoctonia solani AG-1 IA]|uniref:Lipase n=1 Tax=Thanatephorus cucumeris (strain AG1-IA) TaxID=983506 RepID=L8WZD1_THACA|nr:lipase [Rhizoctonia solani AG-1 IA]